jgi:TolA-binding protein
LTTAELTIPETVRCSLSAIFESDSYDAENHTGIARVIEAGFNSSKSRFYSEEMLRECGPKAFSGVKMFCNHQTDEEAEARPERDVNDEIGMVGDVRWDEKQKALVAPFSIWDTRWRENFANRKAMGKASSANLSITASGRGIPLRTETGRRFHLVESLFGKSLDLVTYAGAGGEVQSLKESHEDGRPTSVADLTSKYPSLKDQIDQRRESAGDMEFEFNESEEHGVKLEEAQKLIKELNEKIKALESAKDEAKEKETAAELEEAKKKIAQLEAGADITEAISKSELPDEAKNRLKEQHKDSTDSEGIDEAIKAEAKYLEKLGVPKGKKKAAGPSTKKHLGDIDESSEADNGDDGEVDYREARKEAAVDRYIAQGKSKEQAERMAATHVRGR